MPKRLLAPSQAFELRQALQVAVLDALLASRRWAPGELVFQGGTSLHLAHGSPRFSEDLDFLVDSGLRLESIGRTVAARLQDVGWLPAGTHLSVGKARDAHNPHTFIVSIAGPQVIGSVRVRLELWKTARSALLPLKVAVAPIRLARGPVAGMQVFVPTAEPGEIFADKVFALAARPYLKPRDVFDLHWLTARGHASRQLADDLRVRLATYPNESAAAWIGKAAARRADLLNNAQTQTIVADDIRRWLPSSWPVSDTLVREMTLAAGAALEHGVESMREIEHEQQQTQQQMRTDRPIGRSGPEPDGAQEPAP